MKFRLRSLFLLISFIAIMLTAGSWVKQSFVGSRGSGVTARRANQYLWPQLKLPKTASDVTFAVDFGNCEAEFAISKLEFDNWCLANKWKTNPVSDPVEYYEHNLYLTRKKTIVTSGILFYPPDGEGVFDADQSRANFRASTFP